MGDPIRWGILGTGAVAASFATAIPLVPDARLTVVASRSADKADAFAKAFGARGVAGRDALAAAPDVDVVYVATPNTSHDGDAIALLEAGKAVVCEKPFATTAARARAIVDVARARKLFCMEAMWMRFAPVMRELSSLVSAGEIGDLRAVVAQLGMPFTFDPANRVFDPAAGGGVMLDLGVYPLSFAFAMLGRPTSMIGHAIHGASGVDEQVGAVLGFEGGRQAVLVTSARTRTSNDAMLLGTEGMIRVHEPLYCPESITITKTPPVGGWSGRIGSTRLARLKGSRLARGVRKVVVKARERSITRPVRGAGYAHEIEAVCRCLRARETECAIMPLDETVAIASALDELRRVWTAGKG